ncbi:MAG: hypothetical protein EON98_06010 [Chitinophagaceae bacterium]|nr:MAG: hypothetical protein EON98_06010 [Chitinophagaceae bacterium]
MPKQQTLIQFRSLPQLWKFAQRIQVSSMEINTRSQTLLCECSEMELALIEEYEGKILDRIPVFSGKDFAQ